MKDYIIQRPELQTLSQKLGAFFTAFASWLLWLYFLFPLFTLGGWLLGIKEWSEEIRWFGGYKSLIDLLLLYFEIIAFIMLAWLTCFLKLKLSTVESVFIDTLAVSNLELCDKFHIPEIILQESKAAQKVTVRFDGYGNIMSVEKIDKATL